MKYLNNQYYSLTNTLPILQDAIAKMASEVNCYYNEFHDDPKEMSEWGHNYFCDIDGGRLIFDIHQPHSHVCEICGREFKNKIYDGVWWYFYRNEAVLTMLKAAAVYRATNDRKYLEIVKDLLHFYADNYQLFPIHDKAGRTYDDYETMAWGCGRILPQGLNEAIIAIRMIQALEIVKEDLEQEFLDKLYHELFLEIYKLLKPQVNKLSNISCWKNSAIGMIGLFFDNKEMIEYAIDGPFGLIYQIKHGVTAEKFWYEGSIHYNFFTLEGITMLLLYSKIYQYELPKLVQNTIKEMMVAAYHYAFNNLYFPNPNDGWPNLNLKTYSYIYHVVVKYEGYNSEVGKILKIISRDKTPRTTLPLSKPYYVIDDLSFEQLVLNSDFDSEKNKDYDVKQLTHNYPKSNYGLIRNKFYNVFLKYGHNSKSHAHPDVMNVEITANNHFITRDISNAGYKSKMCQEWHVMSLSHSTVVVDGSNQTSTHPGSIINYNETEITVKCKNVYQGVDYTRSITMNEKELVDHFEIESDELHNYDYLFHLESDLDLQYIGNFNLEQLGYDAEGYQHIQKIYKLSKTSDDFNMKLNNQFDKLLLTIDLKGKDLYILETFDNPVTKMRSTILIREKAKNCNFNLKLEII